MFQQVSIKVCRFQDMRDREPLGLKSLAVLTLLDRLSGHSRSLDERPTSSRRRHSMPTPSSPTHGRKISNYQPPPPLLPHPPPHTHCITPPLIETDTSEQPRFDEQPQSKLLQLPEEILLLIYEQVIGNQVLHIVRRHHKLCHTSCLTNGDTDACKEAQCRGFKLPNGLYAEGSGSEDLIPLLQVCRKMYGHLPIPYSVLVLNVFKLRRCNQSPLRIQYLLLRQSRIRRLRLHHHPPATLRLHPKPTTRLLLQSVLLLLRK